MSNRDGKVSHIKVGTWSLLNFLESVIKKNQYKVSFSGFMYKRSDGQAILGTKKIGLIINGING